MSIEKSSFKTPIHPLGRLQNNDFFIKREDLIPFSFGGNKARKARLFFDEILAGDYNCVVTYGSSSSNHCRIVANLASAHNMECYIISPMEASEDTFNSYMMRLFEAKIEIVPTEKVSTSITNLLSSLQEKGKKPYFIAGGGHGNLGTQAYVECYREIEEFEQENHLFFDYIFHASGTGTTQAGLICGKLLRHDTERSIVGISIARKQSRGRPIVLDSIREYLAAESFPIAEDEIESATIFDDSYTGGGYGSDNSSPIITDMLQRHGIPLDSTYTGKALFGMLNYLQSNKIEGKNILFLHTGGTPLFFDWLTQAQKNEDASI